MRLTPFQKLARFALVLSLVSLPLVINAWQSRAGSWRIPLSAAVTMASHCVWGADCESPLPKPDLAHLPVRLLPPDLRSDHVPLPSARAEAGLYSNPADLPRLARKVAPPGADDVPFC